MRRSLSILMILLLCYNLVGCVQDYTGLKQEVNRQNKKVDRVVTSYEKNKKIAKAMDYYVKQSIQTGATLSNLEDYYVPTLSVFATDSLFDMLNTEILTYLLEYNEVVKNQGERGMLKEKTLKNLLDDSKIYYFLADSSGDLEQYMVLDTGNKIYKLSIYWSDGGIYDIKTSTRN